MATATNHDIIDYVIRPALGDEFDAETFDRRKADDYEVKFRAYCARAKAEQGRARRQVGTVQYGGY